MNSQKAKHASDKEIHLSSKAHLVINLVMPWSDLVRRKVSPELLHITTNWYDNWISFTNSSTSQRQIESGPGLTKNRCSTGNKTKTLMKEQIRTVCTNASAMRMCHPHAINSILVVQGSATCCVKVVSCEITKIFSENDAYSADGMKLIEGLRKTYMSCQHTGHVLSLRIREEYGWRGGRRWRCWCCHAPIQGSDQLALPGSAPSTSRECPHLNHSNVWLSLQQCPSPLFPALLLWMGMLCGSPHTLWTE